MNLGQYRNEQADNTTKMELADSPLPFSRSENRNILDPQHISCPVRGLFWHSSVANFAQGILL